MLFFLFIQVELMFYAQAHFETEAYCGSKIVFYSPTFIFMLSCNKVEKMEVGRRGGRGRGRFFRGSAEQE